MIHSFFKKLPPSVSVPAFYCFITGALFFRFLFASVYGVLFLVIGLYVYAKIFTTIRPLTLSELVAWTAGLPSGYKIALLSSSVTIMGFVVAFHTATANWRNQMRAQLKAQAAGEIEIFLGLSGSLNAILTNNYYELDALAENQSV